MKSKKIKKAKIEVMIDPDAITTAEREIVCEAATYYPVDMADLAARWRAALPVYCADPGARLVRTYVKVYQDLAHEDRHDHEIARCAGGYDKMGGYLFRSWLRDLIGAFLTDRDELDSAFVIAMEAVADRAWEGRPFSI